MKDKIHELVKSLNEERERSDSLFVNLRNAEHEISTLRVENQRV